MKGKIFNAQEVQAILNGSKVMFREVIKPQPNSNINPVKLDYLCRTWQWATKESRRECPYQVGQKIFCKEKFSVTWGEGYVWYWADDGRVEVGDWKKPQPAQHMKQEHSRLTLLIKEIRVERLAEISDKDLLKEGMQITDEWTAPAGDLDFTNENMDAFKDNWNSNHKKPEQKFEANPWVWVVSFEVINN